MGGPVEPPAKDLCTVPDVSILGKTLDRTKRSTASTSASHHTLKNPSPATLPALGAIANSQSAICRALRPPEEQRPVSSPGGAIARSQGTERMPTERGAWTHLLAAGCLSLVVMGVRPRRKSLGPPIRRRHPGLLLPPAVHAFRSSSNRNAYRHRWKSCRRSSRSHRRMLKCRCRAAFGRPIRPRTSRSVAKGASRLTSWCG